MLKYIYLSTDEHFNSEPITYNKIVGLTLKNYKKDDLFVKKLKLIISHEGKIEKQSVVLKVIDIKGKYIITKVVSL